MNKLAVFVEGYTELVFLTKLLEEIAGKNQVRIKQVSIRGGTRVRKCFTTIRADKPTSNQNYFVLIYDCGGDEGVKSRIIEEHQGLTQSGYSEIIGIRDVRPNYTRAQVPELTRRLPMYIKTKLIPVTFILSVMEIEAWFLSEHNHFTIIDEMITCEAIYDHCGFSPRTDDMSLRENPTDDLKDCYAIAGKSYEKCKVDTTVKALDFEYMYLNIRQNNPYLDILFSRIDTFLN